MPTYLGVWSLGLFSPTFFSTSSKKKKLIKKEYCRCGPHPPQVTSPRARPPVAKGAGCIAPRNSGVGHPGLWPPLHCEDPKTLHGRLLLAPHCSPRPPHPSAGGNVRRPKIAGQLDMQEPGDGDYWGRLLTGCYGDDTRAPASFIWLGEVGA